MLVVNIELHSAITGKIKNIGRLIVYNDGTGDRDKGNYKVKVGRRDSEDIREIYENPLREGEVKGYPRLSYNVWRLISRAIRSAFPEER